MPPHASSFIPMVDPVECPIAPVTPHTGRTVTYREKKRRLTDIMDDRFKFEDNDLYSPSKKSRLVREANSKDFGFGQVAAAQPIVKFASPKAKPQFFKPNRSIMDPARFFLADKYELLDTHKNTLLAVDLNAATQYLASLAGESNNSWKSVGLKHGAAIERRKDTGIVRAHTELSGSFSPADVVSWIWSTSPHIYNDMIEFSSRMLTIDDNMGPSSCALLYKSFYGLLGSPGRDFTLLATRQFMDGNKDHAVFACKSVEVKDQEALAEVTIPKRVRAQCHIAGYDVRRLPNGNLKVTGVFHLDLQTSFPSFITNNVHAQSLHHLGNMLITMQSDLGDSKKKKGLVSGKK